MGSAERVILALLSVALLAPPSAAASKAAAEAEVSASSGPLRLTFRLHKTRIEPDGLLWFQVSLKNVGKRKVQLVAPEFADPGLIEVRDFEEVEPKGLHLEIRDPKGKLYNFFFPDDPFIPECLPKEAQDRLEKLGGIMSDVHQAGAREGWSEVEMHDKVDQRATAEFGPGEDPDAVYVPFQLEPGASTTTVSFAPPGICDERFRIKRPRPIPGFARLDDATFSTPGQFKIRAVFDDRPDDVLRRFYHENRLERGEEHFIATPYVAFHVRK
jgi:hypothetical protein